MTGVQRGGRIRGKYTRNERAIIDPFKLEYMKAETPRERQHVAMNLIFKQLFVYWTQNDGVIATDDAQLRGANLAYWLQNNWRPPKPAANFTAKLAVKKSNIFYHLKKEEVFEEIASIIGVDEVDTKTKKWFATRTTAIRNVMDRMTPAEQIAFDKEVKKIEREGYPPEQKQRNAVKHCTQRFQTVAKQHWMEMGVLSFSIATYLNTSNQIVVETLDNAAEVAGIKIAQTFLDRHREKVREIQRLWLDYVRELFNRQSGTYPQTSNPQPGTGYTSKGSDPTEALNNLSLRFSEEGFPQLPVGFQVNKLNKKDGVVWFRTYMAQNYLLATANQSSHVPYKAISESQDAQNKYIDPIYLPSGFQMIDPQNIKLPDIHNFFYHIQSREEHVAPSQVFRFSQVLTSRSSGTVVQSSYPDEPEHTRPAIVKKKRLPRNKQVVEHATKAESPLPSQILPLTDTTHSGTNPVSSMGIGGTFSQFSAVNPTAIQTHPFGVSHIATGGFATPAVQTRMVHHSQIGTGRFSEDAPVLNINQPTDGLRIAMGGESGDTSALNSLVVQTRPTYGFAAYSQPTNGIQTATGGISGQSPFLMPPPIHTNQVDGFQGATGIGSGELPLPPTIQSHPPISPFLMPPAVPSYGGGLFDNVMADFAPTPQNMEFAAAMAATRPRFEQPYTMNVQDMGHGYVHGFDASHLGRLDQTQDLGLLQGPGTMSHSGHLANYVFQPAENLIRSHFELTTNDQYAAHQVDAPSPAPSPAPIVDIGRPKPVRKAKRGPKAVAAGAIVEGEEPPNGNDGRTRRGLRSQAVALTEATVLKQKKTRNAKGG